MNITVFVKMFDRKKGRTSRKILKRTNFIAVEHFYEDGILNNCLCDEETACKFQNPALLQRDNDGKRHCVQGILLYSSFYAFLSLFNVHPKICMINFIHFFPHP